MAWYWVVLIALGALASGVLIACFLSGVLLLRALNRGEW